MQCNRECIVFYLHAYTVSLTPVAQGVRAHLTRHIQEALLPQAELKE